MKVMMICQECENSSNQPTYVEMSDDGIYSFTCDNGHKTVATLQVDKFALLFDSGALSLLDGYTREAVSSFAASLERFHEFCIKTFLTQNEMKKEVVADVWKDVVNQSERQLGAYIFLYLREFGEAPPLKPLLRGKFIEFRNNVIHKGYIAKYQETFEYGEAVLNYIYTVVKKLREKHHSSMMMQNVEITAQAYEKHRKTNPSIIIPTLIIATIVNMIVGDDFGKTTFQQGLDTLKKQRDYFYRK